MNSRSLPVFPAAVLLAMSALFCIGCERDERIVTYQAPKEVVRPAPPPPPAAVAQAPASPTAGGSGMGQLPPESMTASPEAAQEIGWVVPDGWKQLPGDGQLRVASFEVIPGDSGALLTVIPLGGTQPLAGNVNRWEKQVGLEPTPEADLSKVVKHVDVNGTHVDMVELIGPETANPREAMLAAVISRPDRTWFLKLHGPAKKVTPQKEKFEAFVRSIQFRDSSAPSTGRPAPAPPAMPPTAMPSPVPSGTGAPTEPASVGWKVPDGWKPQPEKPMRVATFRTSGDADACDVVVSQFGLEAYRDRLGNVNRWRGMVGLPPVTDVMQQPVEAITIGGTEGQFFEFRGGAGEPKLAMLVAAVTRGENVWFFRFSGPDKSVEAQKPVFEAFLKSVQW